MGRGHLDVVAEHVVVADLERADAGRVLQLGLEAGDVAAGLVAQVAQLIELGVPARAGSGRRRARGTAGCRPAPSSSRRTRSASSAIALALGASGEAQPARLLLDRAPARASPLADRVQIARPAAAERQARERALQVRAALERRRADRRAAPARRAAPGPHRAAGGSARRAASGAARRVASRRPPAPVTVRSTAASRLPWRSPARLASSSRLRRVAASISRWRARAPRAAAARGAAGGPFWVSST